MILSVENLSFAYENNQVLTGVSFSMEEGQIISVLGPNGVGKSTLFKCVLGILAGYAGRICLYGKELHTIGLKALSQQIAYVPQSSYPAFNYTALDMVLMATAANLSPFASPGKKEKEAALSALAKMNIESLAHRDYMCLSGGERQLVLIARALAQQSRVLIMDEPTANLDYGNQLRVLEHIHGLTREGYAVLQSTHNPEQSYFFSNRILAMHGGKIIAQGAPRDILNADLIRALYGIHARVESLDGDRVRVCVPLWNK